MRNIIIIYLIGVLVNSASAQYVDTSLVLKNLKLHMFKEIGTTIWSNIFLEDYFNRDLNVSTLESKGFNQLIFFKINEQILAVDSVSVKNRVAIRKTEPCLNGGDECYFVFAYNIRNGRFYGIKGVRDNEFYLMYNDLQFLWRNWKPIHKIKKSTRRLFLKDYWIEGVDIECLLKSLKKKNGSCLDPFSRFNI